MALSARTQLGPYEIQAHVGAGGMGEVYRARDTRLDRTVAVKIMNADQASFDATTLDREARAAAALNHPHICALHDIGRDGPTPYLVMEYLAGETLSARLRRGPLPPRDVIRCGIQIAEALDHAHRHGVVHRDLKPSNIMLTRSGVKVLDFGLATLRAGPATRVAGGSSEGASTAKHQLTSERSLCGSVHYMAPERLEGHAAGPASDTFAFGAVMYEMATGFRAFEGDSAAGVIDAILHVDPGPASAHRPDLPPSIDWVIQKCLAKNPEARWQGAGDLVEVLRWLARATDTPVQPPPVRRWLRPLIAVSILGLAGVLWAFTAVRRPAGPGAPALKFSILPPPGAGFMPTPSSVPTQQFALAPDGTRLVFVASSAHGAPVLWVRPLDALEAAPLPGTQGAQYPFWSPDGQSIAFFADGALKRIDLSGGTSRVLAAAPNARGGTWSREGGIVFAPTTQGGLLRVPAAGGQPVAVTTVDGERREASHRWPQFLPDGNRFLYFVQSPSAETQGIYEADLGSLQPRKILSTGLSAAYVPPDHLLFVVDDELLGTRFDWQQQRTLGEPFRIAAPVAGSSNFSAAFSVSATGLLAYASTAATSELVWNGRGGQFLGSVGEASEYVDFRLGAGDRQLALAEVNPQNHRPDIRVLDLDRGSKIRLTYDPATDASPVWSPDGQRITFRSNRIGVHNLYQMLANGSGQAALLFESHSAKYPTDWMPDGRIVYHAYAVGTGSDIWLMNPDGSGNQPLLQTPFDEMQGQVSADGRWLAYTSVGTGRAEVYIRSLSNPTLQWQASAGGGTDPRWRGDGRELFYLSADSWLTAVPFADGDPAAPRKLFRVHVAPSGSPYLSNYDVTQDGQRFLLKVPVHDVTSLPIHIVTSWLPVARGRS